MVGGRDAREPFDAFYLLGVCFLEEGGSSEMLLCQDVVVRRRDGSNEIALGR